MNDSSYICSGNLSGSPEKLTVCLLSCYAAIFHVLAFHVSVRTGPVERGQSPVSVRCLAGAARTIQPRQPGNTRLGSIQRKPVEGL